MKFPAAFLIFLTLFNLVNCNDHDKLVALINYTADKINNFVGSLEVLQAGIVKEIENYKGPYKQPQIDMFTITTCTKLTSRIITCDEFKRIVNDALRIANKIAE
ncbi:hypothetical protein ACKWTF_014112 [Chironomus riparius]